MMIPEQNTPEWKEWRRSRIGASDCPIIMGVSPWKTALQLWEEKEGLREEPPMSAAMLRGTSLEETARKAYEKETGLIVIPRVIVHKEIPWMIASMDGMTPEGDHAVELKVPGSKTIIEAIEGIVPVYYYLQIQHQLACNELLDEDYYVYDDNIGSGYCINVPRNDELIKTIIEKETIFYGCMQTHTPPDLDEKDRYLSIDSPEWITAAREWTIANRNLKSAQDYEKKSRAALIELTDDGNCMGGGVKLTRMARQGFIDWDSVCEAYNIDKADLEPFRRQEIGFWKIEEE